MARFRKGWSIAFNSSNPVVAKALNASHMSTEEFNQRYESAFRVAARSSLREVERGLIDLKKVTLGQSDVYNALPRDIHDFIKGWIDGLSLVQAVIHRLK